jgi:hypothetical protein
MFNEIISGVPLLIAAVNSKLCVKGGGKVVPKVDDVGEVEYWCVGGQFDGHPVMKEM